MKFFFPGKPNFLCSDGSCQKIIVSKRQKGIQIRFLHKSFDVSSSFFDDISYRSVVGDKKLV